jgi:hypothetical protein
LFKLSKAGTLVDGAEVELVPLGLAGIGGGAPGSRGVLVVFDSFVWLGFLRVAFALTLARLDVEGDF